MAPSENQGPIDFIKLTSLQGIAVSAADNVQVILAECSLSKGHSTLLIFRLRQTDTQTYSNYWCCVVHSQMHCIMCWGEAFQGQPAFGVEGAQCVGP
ncbi:hypothetical protein COCSUDRAFT_31912 [Coccomyxa subellipsoidea C-169]|uniref:Uncharacterized protein n=1 Tax=Coccomyxa subellipsoidea (strain C-169) TaxID=574566 RepID=I0Z8U0_COCSC|nr:hypothetical protein COCSUDRAFT_31912 [Coccomyxa subellipsoidea C-169]EIE27059.1 hypothetical protein COCSUDRAFT_31912 [Coccomyxa subellipsoidea C-169]|eukprot:XP_005651603.1 hypothetical protein COCSUDRAFT_31912 [Coccomyxa subellipsoidea C-169]